MKKYGKIALIIGIAVVTVFSTLVYTKRISA